MKLPRHVTDQDGTLVYDRPADDELCAKCERVANRLFVIPGAKGSPIPMCERCYAVADALMWPGRGKSHARERFGGAAMGRTGKTLCGRVAAEVRCSHTVTCRSCERIHLARLRRRT